MTMLARKIGKNIIPVVEKFTELETIVRHAEELRVKPVIGVRVKLASRGAGRWKFSAGFRSKFGLTLTETLEAFEYLKERDMADCLQLVHFHLGSQITNIRSIKSALTEASRVYGELHRVGAGVRYLDVGGRKSRRRNADWHCHIQRWNDGSGNRHAERRRGDVHNQLARRRWSFDHRGLWWRHELLRFDLKRGGGYGNRCAAAQLQHLRLAGERFGIGWQFGPDDDHGYARRRL